MAAVVRAGQTSVGLWLLSCTFVFQSAAVPGLTFFKSPNIAKPAGAGLQPVPAGYFTAIHTATK